MHITVNDQNLAADFSHLGNLEEILAEIHENHLPPGQQLFQVRLNGEFFTENYPGESRYLAAEEIHRLEVKTVSDQVMAQRLLEEAVAQAGILVRALGECARLFRVAPEGEANRSLAQVLEALRWLLRTGEEGLQVVSRENSGQGGGPRSMARFLQRLTLLLAEMEEIAGQEDYVMLADLLEYELLPMVEEWRTLVTALIRP